jgi:catechol-2,3-dioxygenase
MIPIHRLGHIVLRVADLERSKRFYVEHLGMHVLEQDPAHGGIFLGLGTWGNTLDLFQSTDTAASKPYTEAGRMVGLGMHHFAFAVENQSELRDGYFALVDHHVPIIAALDHRSQQSVYFSDPDGNIVEIYWERPNAAEIFKSGRGDEDVELVFERVTAG